MPVVGRIVTSMPSEAWRTHVRALDRDGVPVPRYVRRLVTASRGADAVVLLGAAGFAHRYADQQAALALRLVPRAERPAVVLAECTWQPGSAALQRLVTRRAVPRSAREPRLGAVARAAVRAIDGPHVTYCVLSEAERRLFAETWRLPESRIAVTRFCRTLENAAEREPLGDSGGVFAGGDSLRDYETLLAALRDRAVPATLATGQIPARAAANLPPTVTAGRVPHTRFVELLRRATVVVVPLFGDTPRGAGHQTVLNAMVLRKPVIVSDAPGIREYVQDGRDGIVVPPSDPEALGAALDRVLAGGPAIRAMTERAHARVEREFTPRSYLERLLAVACRAAGTWGAQRG